MISQILEILEIGKTVGTDGALGYILKECKQEMNEPITDMINCSLNKGRFL